MMRPLQAIILDFDGVIANSEHLHLRAFQDALADTGLTLTTDAYYSHYLGFDDADVFRALSADLATPFAVDMLDRLVAKKCRRYETLAAEGEMLFPGVGAFIRSAALEVPMAIASGALTREIEDVLRLAGLRAHFLAVVGADQTANSKPAPDPYLAAFDQMRLAADRQIDPRRTVAVEDSRWGLESARAAGLRTVAVTNTYVAAALVPHAELVVDGLDGLDLTTLDRLCER